MADAIYIYIGDMSPRKAPPSKRACPNQDIVDMLLELSDYERNIARNGFKAAAYKKAAAVVADYPERLSSGDQALQLEGIGTSIAKKIDQFLRTGTVDQLEQIHKDGSSDTVRLLASVVGVGPVKAKELYDRGVRSIADLRRRQDRLSLTRAQRIGLAHFEDFNQRIPREEIARTERVLVRTIQAVDPALDVTLCGSYRRGLDTSADIDVLVACNTSENEDGAEDGVDGRILRDVVAALERVGLLTDVLGLGAKKCSAVCRLAGRPHRRIDLRLFPRDQYHCGVLYFTGSGEFNKRMRARAQHRGFLLNEYSIRRLSDLSTPLAVTSEKDVFDYIGYPFKEPHERNL